MADAGVGEAALATTAVEGAKGAGEAAGAAGAAGAGADLLGPSSLAAANAFMDPAAAAAGAAGASAPTALGTAEAFMGGAGAGLGAEGLGGAAGAFPNIFNMSEATTLQGGAGTDTLGGGNVFSTGTSPAGGISPVTPTSAGPSNFALPSGAAPSALPPDPTSAIATGGTAPAPDASVFSTGTNPITGLQQTPGVAGGAAPAGTAPTATPPSFLDRLGTGAIDSITKNPIGTALAAGGLGYSMLQGQARPEGTDQLRASAQTLSAQADQMRSYLQSGTLPPGVKASVDQASAAARARIIAGYAGRGLPTDPVKNSALAQELSAVDTNAAIATAQIGQQLLTTGISEAGLADQLYESLVKIDQTQTANTGKAIANFASALGGSKGPTIQLGGTSNATT